MPSFSEPSQPELSASLRRATRPAQVRWYSLAKGYGFARLLNEHGEPDLDDRDVFLHHSSLPHGQALAEGEHIHIEMAERDRGPYAVRIERQAT